MGAQFSAGRVLENLIPRDRIGQYSPAGRDGHQIHPCRVRWIDSVKINPSLVMMRECKLYTREEATKAEDFHYEKDLQMNALAVVETVEFISQ